MEKGQVMVPNQPKISLEECDELLRNKFKNNNTYKITDYKLINFKEKCGFLGDHFQLKITVSTSTTESEDIYCFAKFMPNTQVQIDFVLQTGAFKKEVYLYETLFPRIESLNIHYLQSCIPQYYFAKKDYVIICEDIGKLNYQPVSKFKFLDYDYIIVVLQSLAKIHASSLIFEEKLSNQLNKKYRLIDEYGDYFYETFYLDLPNHKGGQGVYAAIKGLQAEVDLFFNNNNKVEFKKWLEIAGLDLFKKVKTSEEYRNVLCHGDLWNTNFMIKYKEDKPHDCKIFDFQTMRYCPPAHDFMSFIHLTTTKNFRKENFKNLQNYYYNELTDLLQKSGYNLQQLIPFEEFIASCRDQRRFAAILAATYSQMTQIKNEYIQDFIQDNDKWDEAMYKDRSLMVTTNCERDVEYKKVLQDTMEELWEIFEENR